MGGKKEQWIYLLVLPPLLLNLFLSLSPPVCCFSLLICHIAEVSPLSPDLFMIWLLISFTVTPESASQIKILRAKCVPCSAHRACVCACIFVCVCVSEREGKKSTASPSVYTARWSRCLNNPLSDYMRVLHAYAKLHAICFPWTVWGYIYLSEHLYSTSQQLARCNWVGYMIVTGNCSDGKARHSRECGR